MEVYASGGVARQRATTPPNCCSMEGFSTIALMPTARAAASAVGDRYPDTSRTGRSARICTTARATSRPDSPDTGGLLLQVDPVEVFDRAVVEALRLGHGRVGHLVAECAHMNREALGKARLLCQPVEALYEHVPAPRAMDQKPLELDRDPEPASRKVTGPAGACVVAPAAPVATVRTDCCFFWRRNTRTLA